MQRISAGSGRKNASIKETVASLPGADSKIARQEQGESTWDPLNASELAPNSANGLIPSLIAWAKSQPPGNVAIVSDQAEVEKEPDHHRDRAGREHPGQHQCDPVRERNRNFDQGSGSLVDRVWLQAHKFVSQCDSSFRFKPKSDAP